MRLDIYVNYRGNCEEAFRFYEQHLGGKLTGIVRTPIGADTTLTSA